MARFRGWNELLASDFLNAQVVLSPLVGCVAAACAESLSAALCGSERVQ